MRKGILGGRERRRGLKFRVWGFGMSIMMGHVV